MSMTLSLDRPVFAMLSEFEDDPSRHATEIPEDAGPILAVICGCACAAAGDRTLSAGSAVDQAMATAP